MHPDTGLAKRERGDQLTDFLNRMRTSEFDTYKEVPIGTHIVEAFFQGEKLELNPTNTEELFKQTVSHAAEFILGHEEGVTLIIPLTGGFPLASGVIEWLRESGYDLSKLDLRFVEKFEDGYGTHYMMDGEDVPLKNIRVMVDDIVDKVGENYRIRCILKDRSDDGSLICFTPLVKAEGVDSDGNPVKSTAELAREKDLTIRAFEETEGSEYADINYAAVLPNEWIDCGFGMNSGNAETLSKLVLKSRSDPRNENELNSKKEAIDKINSVIKGYKDDRSGLFDDLYEVVAEIQALERFAPICLAGKPENFVIYGKYLRTLFKIYQNKNKEAFNALLRIEYGHFMMTGLINGKSDAIIKIGRAREYFEGLKGIN